MTYNADQILQMNDALEEWFERGENLSAQLYQLAHERAEAEEITIHGFMRRQSLIEHLINRVFEVVPPDCSHASRLSLLDVTTFLQAFVINIYGAIDNLAQIWNVSSDPKDGNGRKFRRAAIGLRPSNDAFKATLPTETQEYLRQMAKWFKYLEDFRHALAHRIPLYIPPYTLNEDALNKATELRTQLDEQPYVPGALSSYYEQINRLGKFTPIIVHSLKDSPGTVYFHSQIICDYATVVELGEKMLAAVNTTSR